MSDTVFEGVTTPVTQPLATTEAPSLLTALVGETQKYKTPEELAKGYANAEEFINTLKSENASLRTQVQQAKSFDDVLAKLGERQSIPDDTQVEQVSTESIAQIVQQQITGMEAAKTSKANLLKADKAMKERFGEKAGEVFAQVAATPELKEVYTKLAAVDPDKFVALFAPQQDFAGNQVDVSTVNTAGAFQASPRVEEWSKAWVTKVRQDNPKKYWSSGFQAELAQNATKYFR